MWAVDHVKRALCAREALDRLLDARWARLDLVIRNSILQVSAPLLNTRSQHGGHWGAGALASQSSGHIVERYTSRVRDDRAPWTLVSNDVEFLNTW